MNSTRLRAMSHRGLLFLLVAFFFATAVRVPNNLGNSSFEQTHLKRRLDNAIARPYRDQVNHPGIELAEWGYVALREELQRLGDLMKSFCSQSGVACLQDAVEIEVTYMRLRYVKPKVVWEISPSHGFSTLVILSALLANENGAMLYSFDVQDISTKYLSAPEFQPLTKKWRLIEGDVRDNVFLPGGDLKFARPDYLFLDSFHSATFGKFYVTALLPEIQRAHTYVSLHDVYNPSFWSDEKSGRDIAVYPAFLPNEEGIVVLDWLNYRYLSDACNLYTFAPSKLSNAPFLSSLLTLRKKAGIPHFESSAVESTIFFELGCRM